MRRLTYFVALVLTLCCGWSVGYKTSPTDHDVTFATNTAHPALSVLPMPVYAPQIAAMEESVPMEFSNGELIAIVVLVILTVAFSFLLSKLVELAKALRDMVSPEVARTIASGLRQGTQEVSEFVMATPNKIDDSAWENLKPKFAQIIDELLREREQENTAAG